MWFNAMLPARRIKGSARHADLPNNIKIT
jgi:hypothetical protein